MYVADRTAHSVSENDNNVPMIKLAKTEISTKEKRVEASVFGFMDREAIYREGLGCVLITEDFDPDQELIFPERNHNTTDLPFPYGNKGIKDTLFEEVDYVKLQQALDLAFEMPEMQQTRTVLVAYKDHIIGERYVEGFDHNTPILGWSMTKSVLATLFGNLQYRNQIDVGLYKPFDIDNTNEEINIDPRKHISLNDLLRMQSGLAWDEDYSSMSDVTRMLFLDSDMSQAQARTEVIAEPGVIWNYSSGTSNLLSGILRKQFKSHQEYLNFPYSALIDKMGMHSMLIETDLHGNFVGSSYGWGSTRDWAKFGILYLHEGDWNGERIFHPNWATYVSTPTAHSDGKYGAHFWLNANGKYPDVPRDLYSANGYQGQYVFIIPSKNVVIVRTGLAEDPEFNVNDFLKNILAALP